MGHDEPHRCSPQPATRDCAEALSVELALSGYTLRECKAWWISRRSARHYELRDSLGNLVTSITLGKSADKDCWKDLMRSSLSVPNYWCVEKSNRGACPPVWWDAGRARGPGRCSIRHPDAQGAPGCALNL